MLCSALLYVITFTLVEVLLDAKGIKTYSALINYYVLHSCFEVMYEYNDV